MAVLATGFLMQQKRSRWAIVVAINAALLSLFLINPLTSIFVFLSSVCLATHRRIHCSAVAAQFDGGKMACNTINASKNNCWHNNFSFHRRYDAASSRQHSLRGSFKPSYGLRPRERLCSNVVSSILCLPNRKNNLNCIRSLVGTPLIFIAKQSTLPKPKKNNLSKTASGKSNRRAASLKLLFFKQPIILNVLFSCSQSNFGFSQFTAQVSRMIQP